MRRLALDLLAAAALALLIAGVPREAGIPAALFAAAAWAMRRQEPSFAVRGLSRLATWAEERGLGAVVIAAAVWAALVGAHAQLRYQRFEAGAFDLSIFDQAIWATSRGEFLRSSIKGASLLADHFNPLGALLAPLFWIWDDPRALLWSQTLALASGAVPLFLLARREVGPRAAVIVAFAYLCYAPLRNLAAFDFHTEALEVPLFLWAFERLSAGKGAAFVAFALAAALGKESGALACAGLGLYAALATPHRRAGAAVAALGALLFVGGVFFVPRWVGGGFQYYDRYAAGADGPGEVLRVLLGDPARLATFLVWPPRKIEFLLRLLAPLAFLPILGWRRVLPVAPVYAALAASTYPAMHSVTFQYTTELAPFLCWAAVGGLARLAEIPARRWSLALAACAAAMIGQPETAKMWALAKLPSRPEVALLLARVPREDSVAAQGHLAPRLAHRHRLLVFPAQVDAEWIAVEPGGFNYRFMGGAEGLAAAYADLPARGYVKESEAGGVELWRRSRGP